MKRFRFAASQVLAVGKQKVITAELAVAGVVEEINFVQTRIDREHQWIDRLSDGLQNDPGMALSHATHTTLGIRKRIERWNSHLTKLEHDLDIAQQALAKARSEHEALSTLRDRELQKHLQVCRREQQAEIEDHTLRKWINLSRQRNG